MKTYDVIIIGAGSVGIPTSLALAEEGLQVGVVEAKWAPGQGQNKAAIGGIRATHSSVAKMLLGKISISIFSTWRERTGEDIGWQRNGYCFVAYTDEIAETLKEVVKLQRSHGLEIDYLDAKELLETIPHLNPEGLRGGTFSPKDGNASPLRAIHSFYREAKRKGVKFHFGEEVVEIHKKGNLFYVNTGKDIYVSEFLINAAGAGARELCNALGFDVPVIPESHEAGITEPVEPFLKPMIVDLREEENSANTYFYQNFEGQIEFCYTPKPPILGKNRVSTIDFFTVASHRLLNVVPCLKNVRIRRIWRGLYPMTPDGNPIIGKSPVENLFLAVGMCGQGFMLGPGVGEYFRAVFQKKRTELVETVEKEFSYNREFASTEKLK